MLILTRRIGEKLMIGEDIEVQLISVKGNNVRLGIEAPRDVTVHREEVYKRIQQKGECQENEHQPVKQKAIA